jgi:segregation and condensation protein A
VPPTVSTEHIHSPVISIRDQAHLIATLLAELGRASFRQLTARAAGSYEVVASFLALLELYREDAVSFEQVAPLGELYVTWNGHDPGVDNVSELTESDDER